MSSDSAEPDDADCMGYQIAGEIVVALPPAALPYDFVRRRSGRFHRNSASFTRPLRPLTMFCMPWTAC